jgi:glycosyltransferase involved in cell wall biosynthesis
MSVMVSVRIAVISDLREENWPSMDLVAEMLVEQLKREHRDAIEVTKVCPGMKQRVGPGSFGFGLSARQRCNADRLLNRFWDYPRFVRRIRNDFDLFHVVDHSYGQLVHQLPPERTIVTCHDLDTFRCLLNPGQEPRAIFFQAMMRRTLSGFCKAAFVTCGSEAIRDELLNHKLCEPDRLAVVPNGVHPSCSPQPNTIADREAAELVENRAQKLETRVQRSEVRGRRSEVTIELLHVGSTIPRKRIDFLLKVFAQVKTKFPAARLLRVGGDFTTEQEALANELKIRDSIVVLPHLERDILAAIYRRAAIVLLPSEREGFGLPAVEAMACGTPVVASDLPVLREAGGRAADYCEVDDLAAWAVTVTQLLNERIERPDQWAERASRAIAQATRFSWAEYAGAMVDIYHRVLSLARSKPKELNASIRHAPVVSNLIL